MSTSSPSNSPARTPWKALARLAALLRPHVRALLACLGIMGVATALSALGPLLVRRAIDVHIASRDLPGLRVTLGAFALVQLGSIVAAYLLRVGTELVGQRVLATLRGRLIEHLLRLPVAFFDRHPSGQLLSRIQSDTQALRALFGSGAVATAADLLLFVSMLAVMAATSLRLTLVLVGIVPAMAILLRTFHRRTHPLFHEVRRYTAEMGARLAEMLEGLPMLASFERRGWALRELARLGAARYRIQLKGEQLFILWFHGINLMQVIALTLVLGAGGVWAKAGVVSLGTLAMFLGYLRRFFAPLSSLSEQIGEIQRALSAAERVAELLDEPVTVAEPDRPQPWPAAPVSLTFEDVWFRYGPAEPWAVAGISFTIPGGQHWAVVGATGSGKSTLVSLLLRFHDPVRGRILVGGVDLRELAGRDLRQHVGLVLQDVDLFPTDAWSNVTLGRPLSTEQVQRAVRRVDAEAVFARLPRGGATDLAEHGRNLSMGERQLLSFARAVAGEPDVLVLDEATSALDPATEARVASGLAGLLSGRTGLVVAHRLATVRGCDRVLVMDRGEVVEEGPPSELRQASGRFAALEALQEGEVSRVA